VDAERVAQCEALIALEPEDTVLRFGLDALYFEADDFTRAAEQCAELVRLDAQYSAAYRYLGQSYAALERRAEAHDIFKRGIAVAEVRGDLQTAKEMQVFLRRLAKQTS
jgi:predicted Zn-dependent protease